jgi:hypothetical protein
MLKRKYIWGSPPGWVTVLSFHYKSHPMKMYEKPVPVSACVFVGVNKYPVPKWCPAKLN